jgi:serine/threonine protein kinase
VLTPGAVLDGRYEIGTLLASGGMGHVYRARRILLDDEVAIKVIAAGGDDAQTIRERFMRESRACAQLRHPGIVSILDFSVDPDGQPYLVMEYLNGPSVRDEIAAERTLDIARVLEIVGPVCSALQMAHDRGIVHRDLKPANIVSHRFASGESVHKVIDFGLANVKAAVDSRLTRHDQFIGTILYASPEQLQGQEVDGRTDVYSLGVVVFEMLTGRPPFEAGTALGVITKHLCDPPPPPSRVLPRLPAWLDAVVGRALAKDPADRWESIGEFGRALAAGAGGSSGEEAGARSRATASELTAKYEIGPVIGTGRLGSDVHAGTHRALGLPVAIRVLRRGHRGDWETVRARFLSEARSLQVPHPSIIQVRDFGEEQDTLYVVTELIEGRSLLQVLDAEAPLEWSRAWRLVGQLVDAMAALHRRSSLACGVNPGIIRMAADEDGERIMISTGGISQVQEILASMSDEAVRGGELGDNELPYVAPEVLASQPASVASDIFAAGVLAYEMVTGIQPFAGRTLPELLGAMLGARPRDPREVAPGVPGAASACILQCLEREPARRFATAAALQKAWRQVAG